MHSNLTIVYGGSQEMQLDIERRRVVYLALKASVHLVISLQISLRIAHSSWMK